MIRILACTAILVGCARTQGTQMPSDEGPLKPLAFMVGRWVGEGEMRDAEKTTPYKSEVTFSWALDKRFLRSDFTMWVDDRVTWKDNSYFGWDKEKNKFVIIILGLDGTIGRGVQVQSNEKDTWVYEGRTGGDRSFTDWRITFRKIDDDRTTFAMEAMTDGRYELKISGTETRKKEK